MLSSRHGVAQADEVIAEAVFALRVHVPLPRHPNPPEPAARRFALAYPDGLETWDRRALEHRVPVLANGSPHTLFLRHRAVFRREVRAVIEGECNATVASERCSSAILVFSRLRACVRVSAVLGPDSSDSVDDFGLQPV